MIMRRFHCAALAAVAVISFGSLASAADMPVKAPVYKAPVAAPASFTWTGCYIGAHAGYGWGNKDWSGYSNGFLTTNFNVDGGLGGGQLGCNYQFPSSNWIVGIEGSISAADINGTGADGYPSGYIDQAKMKALGSVTGRIGWNGWNPQHLFYAKGGWAWARDEYANNYPETPAYTATQNRSGWTVGAGWEWAFARNWSTFLEYNHYDFGNTTANWTNDTVSSIKQTVETVKVGVNYHFFP
jgi:outer membrane immunogenic protein